MSKKWIRIIAEIIAVILAGLTGGAVSQNGCSCRAPSPPTAQEPPRGETPPKPDEPKPDGWNAIGRISIGSTGCSATIIGRKRDDGRYWILTAAHCVPSVGARGRMQFRDGRQIGFEVVAINRNADCSWLISDKTEYVLPYALIADKTPAIGKPIWHGGFGVDRPGNREEGELLAGPDGNGQIGMSLNVSSGDSGGGIFYTETGEVISCVCCTSNRGSRARVWGASPEAIAALKPKREVLEEWTPIEIPLRAE